MGNWRKQLPHILECDFDSSVILFPSHRNVIDDFKQKLISGEQFYFFSFFLPALPLHCSVDDLNLIVPAGVSEIVPVGFSPSTWSCSVDYERRGVRTPVCLQQNESHAAWVIGSYSCHGEFHGVLVH